MLKFLRGTPCRNSPSSHRKKFMKKLLHITVLGLLLAFGYAQAKDDKPMEEKEHKAGKQQEKMKRCNAEAKGMKGDERKMKMSECLKG
jgi:hypothetical protein